MRWLVDASNVIGSRPDGWWRDREGAARRLVAALERFAEASGDPVTVVLDAGPPDLAGRTGAVEVVIAPSTPSRRNAADDEIVRAARGERTRRRRAGRDLRSGARRAGPGARRGGGGRAHLPRAALGSRHRGVRRPHDRPARRSAPA